MKSIKRLLMLGPLMAMLALGAGVALSQTYYGIIIAGYVTETWTSVLSVPEEICISQADVRGGLDKATLDFNLVVYPEDYSKTGDIFVGLRLRSRPDALWLKEMSGDWHPYDPNAAPRSFFGSSFFGPSIGHPLNPLMWLSIIREPTDITSLADDGEIFVG